MSRLFIVEYQVDDEAFRPLLGEGNVVFKDLPDAMERMSELYNREEAFFENPANKEFRAEIESFGFRIQVYEDSSERCCCCVNEDNEDDEDNYEF
jgi:hypothetical protein